MTRQLTRLPKVIQTFRDIRDTDTSERESIGTALESKRAKTLPEVLPQEKLSIKTALDIKGASLLKEGSNPTEKNFFIKNSNERKLYYDEISRYIETIDAYILLETEGELPVEEPWPSLGTIYYVEYTKSESDSEEEYTGGPDIFKFMGLNEQEEPIWENPIYGGGLPDWNNATFDINEE